MSDDEDDKVIDLFGNAMEPEEEVETPTAEDTFNNCIAADMQEVFIIGRDSDGVIMMVSNIKHRGEQLFMLERAKLFIIT